MEPVTLHDEVFGELGYDPPLEEWYARAALTPNRMIEVRIWWAEEDGPFAPVLERARTAYQRFVQRESAHRIALATAMLERLCRREPPDEELPGCDEVAPGLTATQISIAADGSATVHYDDIAELFGDHCIFADLAADGLFTGFSIHG
jgi:hypothetical protein